MVELGEIGLNWKGRVVGSGTVVNAPRRSTQGMEWGQEWRAACGPRSVGSCGCPRPRIERREGREAGLFRRERKWCGESASEAARGAGMRRGPRAPGST